MLCLGVEVGRLMGDSSPKRYNENLCDSEGRFPIGFLVLERIFPECLAAPGREASTRF
jgi:hypothetical protein